MTNQILIDLLLWILGFTLLMLPQLQDCIIYGHLLILLSQRSFIFKKGFDSHSLSPFRCFQSDIRGIRRMKEYHRLSYQLNFADR